VPRFRGPSTTSAPETAAHGSGSYPALAGSDGSGGGGGAASGDTVASEEAIPADLDLTRVPPHVAWVMDGNGRWAQRRGLPRTEGHAAGEAALFDVVEGALALGVRWLTVYAFSTENWRRPPDEVRYLMGFNESLLRRRRDELHQKGVRIRFAGRRDWRVPRRVLRRMDESIELTRDDRRMTLTMAFNYGGRAEIVDAVRDLVASGVPASRVDERTIRRHLYFPDMPDPDLVIRTSGEYRISNFLLWEVAYSELLFVDTLWPDVRRRDLYEAVLEYQHRHRRYGGVGS
jgi:undecaprenyl diphosphate synthase